MTRRLHTLLAAASLAGAALLGACGGNDGVGSGGTGRQGTLAFSLTDAPSCGYDAVNVSIAKVRVHQSATAADNDAGWYEIVPTTQRYDLLTLTNGVMASLGQTPLPAGHYQQVRLVLVPNDASNPLANSVVPTGEAETALVTPSAQESGLKINADITVEENQLADYVLDFDACKSVVKAGNSGRYLLKPVLSVTPNFLSGVQGELDPALAGATVSVQQAGVVVKSTVASSTGHFLLEPVAPGTYDVVVSAPGRTTMVVIGVPVADQQVTSLNTAATALVPPVAATGTASGTVSATGSPIVAYVSATQTLAGGHVVDVGDTVADGSTGAWALSLPAAAPLVAPWSTTGLLFVTDVTAGTSYGLRAESGGVTKTAGPVSITSGGTVTVNFAF